MINVDKIYSFLKKSIAQKKAIIGVSGGIDSTVVLTMLLNSLAKEQVIPVVLPTKNSQLENIEDAKNLCKDNNLDPIIIDIDPIIENYSANLPHELSKVTQANLQARIRMTILYAIANQTSGLVVGTGNKTELSLGYFTKHGDGGVDLLPIGHLYKTEVYQLAKQLDVDSKFITKPPTADLFPGQTDEKEIGLTYPVIDEILQTLDRNEDLSKLDQQDIDLITDLVEKNKHKKSLPPLPF